VKAGFGFTTVMKKRISSYNVYFDWNRYILLLTGRLESNTCNFFFAYMYICWYNGSTIFRPFDPRFEVTIYTFEAFNAKLKRGPKYTRSNMSYQYEPCDKDFSVHLYNSYIVFVPLDWTRTLSPVCFWSVHNSMNFCMPVSYSKPSA